MPIPSTINAPDGSTVTAYLRAAESEEVWNTNTASWEDENGLTLTGDHFVATTSILSTGGFSRFRVSQAVLDSALAATAEDSIQVQFFVDGVYDGNTSYGEQRWSDTERQQIRHRLGIDGASAAPTATPNLGTINSQVIGFLGSPITEVTAGRIAGNVTTFFANADESTSKVVDDVGTGGVGSCPTIEEIEASLAALDTVKLVRCKTGVC